MWSEVFRRQSHKYWAIVAGFGVRKWNYVPLSSLWASLGSCMIFLPNERFGIRFHVFVWWQEGSSVHFFSHSSCYMVKRLFDKHHGGIPTCKGTVNSVQLWPIEIGYIEGERVIKINFGFMYTFTNSWPHLSSKDSAVAKTKITTVQIFPAAWAVRRSLFM